MGPSTPSFPPSHTTVPPWAGTNVGSSRDFTYGGHSRDRTPVRYAVGPLIADDVDELCQRNRCGGRIFADRRSPPPISWDAEDEPHEIFYVNRCAAFL